MDQVQKVLQEIKKHHFWILSGVAVIAAVSCWWIGTSKGRELFEQNRQARERPFAAVSAVHASWRDAPNQRYLDELQQMSETLANEVLEAWRLRYEEQKPLFDQILGGQEVREAFEQFPMLPPKKADGTPMTPAEYFNSLPPEKQRRLYEFQLRYFQDFRGEWQRLFDLIDLRRPESNPAVAPPVVAPGATPPGTPRQPPVVAGNSGVTPDTQGATPARWVGLVSWPTRARVTTDYFAWTKEPNAFQVRYAVEYYVVMHALLETIAKTNEGARYHMEANIKQLKAVEIGPFCPHKEVYRPPQAATPASGSEASGNTEEGSPPPAVPVPVTGTGGLQGQGGSGGPAARRPSGVQPEDPLQLFAGRYVKLDGGPVMQPEEMPFAEFRIMPVRLVLVMDYRRVPKLLVNTINNPFPLEVQQVNMRLLSGAPQAAPARQPGTSTQPQYSEDGSVVEPPMEFAPRGTPMTSTTDRDATGSGGELVLGPYDAEVEVRGVVYIFNPPDRDKLGTAGTRITETIAPATN